jgi:hypothetical protein
VQQRYQQHSTTHMPAAALRLLCATVTAHREHEPADIVPQLGEAECAAIGQLVQLTSLQLKQVCFSDHQALRSSLQQLIRLQELHMDGLSAALLPVLAGLTGLTSLGATWKHVH